MDKEGKSKGLAVVQFSHPIEAVQAISMLNHQYLYDRAITVKMDKFEKPTEVIPGELPQGLRAIGMGLGADGAPLADVELVLNQAGFPVQSSAPPRPSPFVGSPSSHVAVVGSYASAPVAPTQNYGTPAVSQVGGAPYVAYGGGSAGGGYPAANMFGGGGYGAVDVGFSVSRCLLIKNVSHRRFVCMCVCFSCQSITPGRSFAIARVNSARSTWPR